MVDFLTEADDHLVVLIETDDGGVQDDLDTCLIGFLQELLPDVEAADLCLMLLGAEELVDLLEQLSAGAGILIKDNGFQTALCGLDRRGKTGRAGTDNDEIKAFDFHFLFLPRVSTADQRAWWIRRTGCGRPFPL